MRLPELPQKLTRVAPPHEACRLDRVVWLSTEAGRLPPRLVNGLALPRAASDGWSGKSWRAGRHPGLSAIAAAQLAAQYEEGLP